jgi:hypothetical protein
MILFFGWGRGEMEHALSPQQVLLLTYSYFHLFWVFRVSWPQGYAITSLTPQGWATQPLSDDEARQYGFTDLLKLPWWSRWGLLVPLGVAVVVVAAAAVTGL